MVKLENSKKRLKGTGGKKGEYSKGEARPTADFSTVKIKLMGQVESIFTGRK